MTREAFRDVVFRRLDAAGGRDVVGGINHGAKIRNFVEWAKRKPPTGAIKNFKRTRHPPPHSENWRIFAASKYAIMPEISQNIALLRHCVEESANHRIKTSTDFTFLAGVIQERLGETVATSTLKRLWGYVDGYASTRESTLNILARFIGYPDWRPS